MASFTLGLDCKLYYGTAGAALSALSLVNQARDVECTWEGDEIDITTRGSGGFQLTALGLVKLGGTFNLLWKPGDAACLALFAAAKPGSAGAGTGIELCFLTGLKSDATAVGWKFTASVLGIPIKQPFGEAVNFDVTVKPMDTPVYIDNATSL